MFNLDINTISIYLTAVVSILGAIITLYVKYVYPFFKQINSSMKMIYQTILDASNIHSIIRKELSTNGGSSIKDCISRIEKKMFVQDTKYRTMLSLLERPIWEADENGMLIWVNRTFIKMFGTDIDDVKNNGWVSLIHENDRDRIFNEWLDCVSQHRVFQSKYKMIKQDGSVINCIGEAFPIESVDHESNRISKCGFIGVLSSEKF